MVLKFCPKNILITIGKNQVNGRSYTVGMLHRKIREYCGGVKNIISK